MLTQIVHNENDKYFLSEHFFQVQLQVHNFQLSRGRGSIKNNVLLYVSSIILCLEEYFGNGDGENVKIDTRVVDGERILHNICTVLEICHWVLFDGIPVNSDNIVASLSAQLESIEILSNRFERVFYTPISICLNILKMEYTSIIIYSLNHLNPLVSDPRQFWKLQYDRRNTHTWNQAFLLLELCLCTSYSTATFEIFFSHNFCGKN